MSIPGTSGGETILTHNTAKSGDGSVPVLTKAESVPPAERSQWHEATDAELTAYETYWDAQDD